MHHACKQRHVKQLSIVNQPKPTGEEAGQGEDGGIKVHNAQAGGVQVHGQEVLRHLLLQSGQAEESRRVQRSQPAALQLATECCVVVLGCRVTPSPPPQRPAADSC